MSDVRMVKLGDICTFMHGGTPKKSIPEYWEGNIPWISSADISIDSKITFRSYISESGVKNSSTNVIPARTVLLVNRTGVGKTTITTVPTAISQDITAIYHNNRIITEYLHYFLESKKNYFISYSRGATIQGFNRQTLEELEIPILSLEEQKRIVSILDKAKSIQEARERQLAALDELEYAIYNEIFADFPLEATLEDLGIDFVSGKNLVGTGENIHQHNKVLKVSAVSYGYFKSQEVKPLPADYSPPSSHLVHKGDILFSRASGSLQLVGITCPVTYDLEDTYLPDKIWRVEATDPTKIDVRFIHYLLKSHAARAYIENMASGAAGVKNISKQKMKSLPCPVVPMEVQQIFLEKTIEINYLRSRIKESLRLSKNTAKNLLHEYIQR